MLEGATRFLLAAASPGKLLYLAPDTHAMPCHAMPCRLRCRKHMRDGVAIGEFPKGATHYQQMRARPGVQQAL
jgi:hypothetical protein